jgi:hypothetical protein
VAALPMRKRMGTAQADLSSRLHRNLLLRDRGFRGLYHGLEAAKRAHAREAQLKEHRPRKCSLVFGEDRRKVGGRKARGNVGALSTEDLWPVGLKLAQVPQACMATHRARHGTVGGRATEDAGNGLLGRDWQRNGGGSRGASIP